MSMFIVVDLAPFYILEKHDKVRPDMLLLQMEAMADVDNGYSLSKHTMCCSKLKPHIFRLSFNMSTHFDACIDPRHLI